ncbi:MAG: NAD(P)H-dependent oxidoreductase [Methanomicrobiales archaeon]|nr:NAD(P)H-dependent oxidoreductase [Methanomicrobiales archaeon]
MENQDRACSIIIDIVNSRIKEMILADGIIIASPTYFADMTAETKALIDCFLVCYESEWQSLVTKSWYCLHC